MWRAKEAECAAVTYYWKPLAILTALCVSMAFADDFKTINGKEYKDVEVSRVEPDGIVLRTNGGISKVYFAELPKEVQERFHYVDASKLDAEKTAKAAAEERGAREAEKAQAEERAEKRAQEAVERFVVAQATAGEVADLTDTKQFPQQNDRKLRAHFLEDLLTAGVPGLKLQRHGVQIIGAIIDEPIDLRNAEIPSEVRLEHCQFNSSLTFASARFAQSVSFEDSTFKADANFNSMKVQGRAVFTKAVFEGRVDFRRADIASDFVTVGAKFQNKEQEATFNSMKVGHTAFFTNAIFGAALNFGSADIASNFQADGVEFQNKEKEAIFNSMKVGHTAFFRHAIFGTALNFGSADIASDLVADGAKFQNKEQEANFNGIKVGEAAFFTNAVFDGPVNFGVAHIGVNFVADGAKFQNKEKEAIFNSMKVGHTAFFRNAVFDGPVDFTSADIASNFEGQGAKFNNKEKEAIFSNMKVGQNAFFTNAVFDGPVRFGYANFASLTLSSTVWPKVAGQLQMQGMTYKYIRAVSNNEPESHKALLKLAEQSAYTADVYSNLEAFFLSQGYRPDADKAFIAGKRREREEYVRSGHWFRWLGSWMLDLLVGYGRRPWQAGIPCAALIALGCVLFSPKKMEPRNPAEAPRVYSRFWYSLGLFLPFVDLQADKVWKPKADETFLRNYMRVHILLGWILVPLVLAALTGLIK